MDAALLSEIKDKLRITWSHEDSRISNIGEMAQDYINGKCKTEFDYSKPGQHKALMLEWCFYYYHNVLHEFEKNYQSELLSLILACAVEKSKGAESGA